jgi:hypothetical protein
MRPRCRFDKSRGSGKRFNAAARHPGTDAGAVDAEYAKRTVKELTDKDRSA